MRTWEQMFAKYNFQEFQESLHSLKYPGKKKHFHSHTYNKQTKYMFKVNKRNTRLRHQICPNFKINITEQLRPVIFNGSCKMVCLAKSILSACLPACPSVCLLSISSSTIFLRIGSLDFSNMKLFSDV